MKGMGVLVRRNLFSRLAGCIGNKGGVGIEPDWEEEEALGSGEVLEYIAIDCGDERKIGEPSGSTVGKVGSGGEGGEVCEASLKFSMNAQPMME